MTISKAYFVIVASEYSAVDADRFTALEEIAALFTPSSVFGAKTDYARALYVAHMLKLDELRGKGAVSSEKVGDVARSFTTPAKDGDALDLTSYGQQFRLVRSSCGAARGPLLL